MSEVDCIIVMLELSTKGQCVVMTSSLPFHRILVVADVTTCSNPTLSVGLGINLGVHQRSHAMVVKRIWLEQIDDVEAVSTPGTSI